MSESLDPEVILLSAALELPAAQRPRFLDEACAANPGLRQQIERLIEAHEQAESDTFLDTVPVRTTLAHRDPALCLTEKAGDRIGRYKLIEQIGEGGCGVVYRAEQEQPVRRPVAVKIIKLGMDTRSVIARFEAERQALAMMDHPNIARVFDAGATETGRPYFVMELVRGVPITVFCDERRLSTNARLGLFVRVCQAIQHAHQKGIIHRDIKPSNILVTTHENDPDGLPVPKVIDFGIAKATQGKLTDQTLFTALEQFIGTPAYMSPEQAVMTSLDIDTRSDIYSLGVLLYELLTGRTPFDQRALLASGLDELRRTLRDKEPPRPSTRMSLLRADEQLAGAKCHQTDPAKLIRALQGDLDWIVMKALEKDRARRYETANGLATDIQRYLDREPVNARPPTGFYRFQRLVQRNKLAFAAIGVLGMALLIVAVGSSVAAWRVSGARQAELRERQKAETANRQLRQTVNLLELERAEDFFSNRDSAAGVAHLAAMLRRDPSNAIAGSRLVSALIHRPWAVPVGNPMRHRDRVVTAVFSPDGRQVLTGSWDDTARLWDARTGQLNVTVRHGSRLNSARFNHDGTRFVSAADSGSARVWDSATGEPCTPRLQHSERVHWAEFSADGRLVISASADKTARIWNASTGGLVKELQGHSTPVVLARFSPDAQRAVTGGSQGSVRIWDVNSGAMILRIEDRKKALTEVEFSPDGRNVVVACEDGIARLWNTQNGQAIHEPMVHTKPIWHATFSADGRLILTTSEDGTAQVWDAVTTRPVGPPMRHESGVVFGQFSPDGSRIVTTSSDNTARVWEARNGVPACQPLRHIERVLHAGFSSDGKRIITASFDGLAQVWELRDPLEPGLQFHHEANAAPLAIKPGGGPVLTAGRNKTARLWNPQSGVLLCDPILHDTFIVSGDIARENKEGNRIVLACADGTARVWDCRATGAPRLMAGPVRHSKTIRWVQFDPDGTRFVTGSDDATARVWNARTGQPLTDPMVHSGPVLMVRFSRDGRFVATASEDGTARIWNVETGRPIGEPLVHIDHVNSVEFSPDGTRVVTASTDNTAGLWDARSGQPMGPRLPHPRMVRSAVFSPDGRRIATACLDRMARLWDVGTGQSLTPPLPHDSFVEHVFFSGDGRRLVTVSRTGLSRFWDSQTGRPLSEWLNAALYWTACFDPVEERLVVGSRNGVGHLWTMPQLALPVPPWFLGLADAVAGVRLAGSGALELVPAVEFERLPRTASPVTPPTSYESIASAFHSGRSARPHANNPVTEKTK